MGSTIPETNTACQPKTSTRRGTITLMRDLTARDLRPVLLQARQRDRHRRLELGRERLDAELFDQPAKLLELGDDIALRLVALLLIARPQRHDLRGLLLILLRIVGLPLEPHDD